MKMKSIALVCFCLAFGGRMASACDTFRKAEAPVMMSNWCRDVWIDFFREAYSFDEEDWNDGFGWSVPCDLHRPQARIFQAIELLHFSSPNEPQFTDDFSGNFLRWAGNYAIDSFDELDGRCSNGTFHAYTWWGTIDDTAEFYMRFFYNENVVQRAGTLVHEARHAGGWCGHNGNDGSNPCPSGSESCDEKLNDGCTGIFSDSGKGANGYQVLWLWWYTFEADAQHSDPVKKALARDDANRIIDNMFDVNPCFHITQNGDKIITC